MTKKTVSHIAITALCAGFAGAPSAAASESLWSSPELQLDTRHQNVRGESSDTTQGRIVVLCSNQASGYCGSDASSRAEAESHAATIGETILEIREWFDETGLLPSALHIRGDFERQVWLHEGYVEGTTRARIRGGSRVSSAYMQVGSVIFDDPMSRSDLAHEWYHTASAASPERRWRAEEEVDNLEEAIAEAVGLSFAFPEGDLIDAHEPLDLHEPFLDNSNYGYEKAPYILFVGERLGAKNNIAHVRNIMDVLSDDGYHGLSYLYDSSFGPAVFDRAYPEFVARMNQPDSDRYYGDVPRTTWEAGDYDAFLEFSNEITIPANAATPLLIEEIEVGGLPEESRDRLAVAQVAIEDAEAPIGTHINLVFEHEATENGMYRWLMEVDEAIEGPFLRATNAGPEPAATEERDAKFTGSMNSVSFELPECMNPGSTRTIHASGGSLDGVDNMEINASAGSTEGLEFTAPDQAGEVDISLSIESPITRGPTISPVQRPDAEIDLGTIDVAEGACMIRMSVGPSQMTFVDDRGGFTKITNSEQPEMRMYVSEDEMTGLIPGQGWTQIPPHVRQMFLGDLDADNMLGDAVPGPDTPFNMSNFPRQMARHLSWENLRHESDRLGIEPEFSEASCPDGSTGCIRASHAGGSLVYDNSRRLVRMEAGPHPITFAYGSFDISLPPGW